MSFDTQDLTTDTGDQTGIVGLYFLFLCINGELIRKRAWTFPVYGIGSMKGG